MSHKKRPLKIGFSDTFGTAIGFFTDVLSRKYELTRDDQNPEVLIFGDPNFGQSHWQYDPTKVVKVFYTGENVRPTYFQHDFAISFDHVNSFWHYRLPLYVLEIWALWNNDKLAIWESQKRIRESGNFPDKTFKYAYVQTNPNCIPRTKFIEKLFHLGENIRCAGPHFNNTGFILPRNDIRTKLDFCRQAKFTICYENGTWPGYATEKLLNAFCAHSIPVYWGSSTIEREFNEKAFVNRHNFRTDEEMLRWIDQLDKDPILYSNILSQLPFTDWIEPDVMNIDTFLSWWDENPMSKVKNALS
jgi:alpha(1,3/1,4) fucosyltransferase